MAGRHRRKTVTEGNCDLNVLWVVNQTEFSHASGEDGRKHLPETTPSNQ